MQYQNNVILNQLFSELKEISDSSLKKNIEQNIWAIWLDSQDEEVNQKLELGTDAINQKKYNKAIDIFSDVIKLNPDFAEAWNKRATAYYLRGSYKKSIDDINNTLALEPRHFGALSGLISMYMLIGNFKGVLKALKKLSEIYPKDENIATKIKILEEKYS